MAASWLPLICLFAVVATCNCDLSRWVRRSGLRETDAEDLMEHQPEKSSTIKNLRKKVGKNECQCGIRKPSFGIIGGQRTRRGEFPWQIAIKFGDGNHVCGGSLITDQWVLTAAHCVEKEMNLTGAFIAAGSNNVRRGRNQQTRNIEQIVRHAEYDYVRAEDSETGESLMLPVKDIALIKVDTKFNFNDYIQTICLPFHLEDQTFDEEYVELSGWGRFLRRSRITSPILYKIIMKILPEEECRKERVGSTVDESQICAEGGNPKGACHGDSGGPMAFEVRPNQFTQVGVVSYGFPECYMASMYTRVTTYLNWIVEHTGVNDFCKPF